MVTIPKDVVGFLNYLFSLRFSYADLVAIIMPVSVLKGFGTLAVFAVIFFWLKGNNVVRNRLAVRAALGETE